MKVLHTLFTRGYITDAKGIVGDVDQMHRLFDAGNYSELTSEIIKTLAFYDSNCSILDLEDNEQDEYDNLIRSIAELISDPKFVVPVDNYLHFVYYSIVYHNMVAASNINVSEYYERANNIINKLFFVNPRNNIRIDIKSCYRENPEIVSWWWCCYISSVHATGTANKLVEDNIKWAFDTLPDDFRIYNQYVIPAYFIVTYLAPKYDKKIKGMIRECLKNSTASIQITNNPRKKKIAIITSKWFKESAIYRTNKPYIEALKNRGYDMTLVHIVEKPEPKIDTELFSNVIRYDFFDAHDKLTESLYDITNNNWELVLYPDIGMNEYSIWLSSLRLAPIQVMNLGHPVSTFGSEIDYVISGIDCEPIEQCINNYSERVVLIPGLGSDIVRQSYNRKNITRLSDKFLINCPWSPMKINYNIIAALAKAQKLSKREIIYLFYPSKVVNTAQSALSFYKDIKDNLSADIVPNMKWELYVEIMEYAHLTLIPYPFGSYNTVVDSLLAGVPVVAIEGDKWYNRCAPGLMRTVGLDDLIVYSIDEFVQKIIDIANDDKYAASLFERVQSVDLDKTIFNDNSKYFADAIDYLVENHGKDNVRDPIIIGANNANV